MPVKAMNRVRAAVVGGGAFGECHLKTFRSMPQVEVAGLFTLERERADALCAKYGGKRYDSLQAIADDPSIDLVSIATPESAHFESFKVLAAAGKAIYVEKPLATALDEAAAMVELSKSIIAMTGHCLRFETRVAQVMQQRDQLGALRHMSFKDRRPREHKKVYGRVHPAYVLLCHEVELANAFAGVPFKRVSALQTHFSAGQVDGLSMMVEYENGTTCVIEGGFLLPDQSSLDENDQISLDYDGGTFLIQIPHTGITFIGPKGSRFINHHYENTVFGMEFGALRAALDYMVECIVTNTRPTISTVEDGFNAVRLVQAAIESSQTGNWVYAAKP